MESIPGTQIGKRSIKQGHPVDCRGWLEFAIVEVLYNKIKLEYRILEKIDTGEPKGVESALSPNPDQGILEQETFR